MAWAHPPARCHFFLISFSLTLPARCTRPGRSEFGGREPCSRDVISGGTAQFRAAAHTVQRHDATTRHEPPLDIRGSLRRGEAPRAHQVRSLVVSWSPQLTSPRFSQELRREMAAVPALPQDARPGETGHPHATEPAAITPVTSLVSCWLQHLESFNYFINVEMKKIVHANSEVGTPMSLSSLQGCCCW